MIDFHTFNPYRYERGRGEFAQFTLRPDGRCGQQSKLPFIAVR